MRYLSGFASALQSQPGIEPVACADGGVITNVDCALVRGCFSKCIFPYKDPLCLIGMDHMVYSRQERSRRQLERRRALLCVPAPGLLDILNRTDFVDPGAHSALGPLGPQTSVLKNWRSRRKVRVLDLKERSFQKPSLRSSHRHPSCDGEGCGDAWVPDRATGAGEGRPRFFHNVRISPQRRLRGARGAMYEETTGELAADRRPARIGRCPGSEPLLWRDCRPVLGAAGGKASPSARGEVRRHHRIEGF